MRRPSKRGFRSTVTFCTKTSRADASGDSGYETYSAGTPLVWTASVQIKGMERIVDQGREIQLYKGDIVFRSLPVDTAPDARAPGLPQERDRFIWTNDLGLPINLYATGPVINNCDRGQSWTISVEGRA